jgi:uncharacterized membrane protein
LKDQSLFLLKKLLTNHHYDVPEKELALRVLSDPDNTVLGITNTLDFFNIQHIAAKVPRTALDRLPNQFIGQVHKGTVYKIVLVTKLSQNKIFLEINDSKSVVLFIEEFLKDWTGFIIAIEENKIRDKENFLKIHSKKILLLFCVFLSTGYIFRKTQSLMASSYFLLSVIGVLLAYFIYAEKLGLNNAVSRFCKVGKNSSCQGVLNSRSSKILNGLDLSDAVAIYFIFTTVGFLVYPTTSVLFMVSYLALLAVPYSIYQQKAVIKQWCPLCLGVSAVLVLQFLALLTVSKSLEFQLDHFYILSIILGLTAFVWLTIKPLFQLPKKVHSLSVENLSFRRNYKLFLPYFYEQAQINTESENIPSISLGAKQPKLELIIITNPLCRSCIRAHKVLMGILEDYKEVIRLNIRFLVSSQNIKDTRLVISSRLLQLYFEEDAEVFEGALMDWYQNLNLKKWIARWGKSDDAKYEKIINQQLNWCLKNNINHTPAVLINNRLFPMDYHTEDIVHFIEPILNQPREINKEIENIHA